MQRIHLISVTWVIATPLIAGHLFLGTAAATTFISVTPQDDLKSIIESAANDTTITLSAGTYNLARYAPFNQAVLIQNKTDLTLQGQGPGQTILKLPSDAQFGFYTGSNVHNLRIENLQIEGTLPLLTNTHGIGNFTGTTNVTNVTFTNLRVRNTAVGISADTSTAGIFDGVTITNNEILGTVGLDPGWGYGIEVTNPTNVLIADNLIREATRHSVYIARAAPGSNVTVEQNTILNHDPEGAQRATTGRWYLAALAVARASDVDVAFNRIVNSRTIALSVEPDDSFGWPTTDINLVGNEIVDAWYVGMWAITGETHTTLGNSITHYPNPDADGNGWGDLTSFINFPAGVATSSSFAPPNPRWAEVDFIAEMNGNIFVMHNGMLDSIVPYDSWDYETSPTVWSGTESLTAVPELGDDGLGRLHIVQDGTLYEIHPITWEFTIPGDTNFSSAGDYNANGVVDAADYTVWRDSLGQAGTDLPADGTGDGIVYRVDYDYWKTRFGDSTGDSGAATVPEPASGTFLFFAWLALLLVGSQPRLSPPRQAFQKCNEST